MTPVLSFLLLSTSGGWQTLGISLWFALIAFLSAGALVISLLFGGEHDHDADHDSDHEHDGGGGQNMSPWSVKILLMATTGFGSGGFFGAQSGLLWFGSSLSGILGAGILGFIGYAFLNALYTRQTNSVVTTASLVGQTGNLDIGISAGGVGRVALTLPSGLELFAARSADGGAIAGGTPVRIVSTAGSTVTVESVSQ